MSRSVVQKWCLRRRVATPPQDQQSALPGLLPMAQRTHMVSPMWTFTLHRSMLHCHCSWACVGQRINSSCIRTCKPPGWCRAPCTATPHPPVAPCAAAGPAVSAWICGVTAWVACGCCLLLAGLQRWVCTPPCHAILMGHLPLAVLQPLCPVCRLCRYSNNHRCK